MPLSTANTRTIVIAVISLSTIVAATATSSLATIQLAHSTVHSASAAPQLPPVDTTGFPHGDGNPGIFTDTCDITQTSADDPIMMPGMTGMSMQHDFFGGSDVTASSRPVDLVGGMSTCSTRADASAYWTPVLFQNGVPMTPLKTLIYWRASALPRVSESRGAASVFRAVQTMPAGISLIAGNESATSAQSDRIIDWTCSRPSGSASSSPAPAPGTLPRDCPAGESIRLVVTFPNCWDGHSLGGREQTNAVYPSGSNDTASGCPLSHPVQIPQIVMHVVYPTSSAAGLTLSTGPTQQGPMFTGHADFLDGWTQSRMDADVAACIDTETRCGETSGPLATPRGGTAAK